MRVLMNNHKLNMELDNIFLQKIRERIADELNQADLLRDCVLRELSRLDIAHEFTADGDETARVLMSNLKYGELDLPVFNQVLLPAAQACLSREGRFFQADFAVRDRLVTTVKQLAGWLLLSVVKDHVLAALSVTSLSQRYFDFEWVNAGGVEVLVARFIRKSPRVRQGGFDLIGDFVFFGAPLQACALSLSSDELADSIKIVFWNRLFPDALKDGGDILSKVESARLNARLFDLEQPDKEQFCEHHILALGYDESVAGSQAGFDKDQVMKRCRLELSNLSVARLCGPGQASYLHIEEASVINAVTLFFRDLQALA